MTRLVHLSDLHFGDADPTLVAGAATAIDALAPDALIVTGDVTQKGRRREFEAARAFLDRFALPVVVAPGNHDTPFAQVFTRVIAPFARFQKRLGAGHAAPLLMLEQAWTRVLNTARGAQTRMDWSLGSANLADVDRAAADLAAAPPDACRIIACHHPLLTPANAPFPARTRRGAHAAKRLAEADVDLVLSGHMHVAFAEPLPYGDARTYAIGATTAFSSRTRGEPAGFNVIEVESAEIALVPHAWDGERFAPGDPVALPRRARNQADGRTFS